METHREYLAPFKVCKNQVDPKEQVRLRVQKHRMKKKEEQEALTKENKERMRVYREQRKMQLKSGPSTHRVLYSFDDDEARERRYWNTISIRNIV